MTDFFNVLKTFFKPPIFEGDEEKTRNARLLHQIVVVSWSLAVITAIVGFLNPSAGRFVVPAGIILAVTLTIIMLLNRAGKVQLGSTILVGMVFSIATFFNYSTAGEPRPILLLSVIVIMMSGLLLGTRGPIVLSILLAVQHMIFVSLHAAGIITPEVTPPGPLQNALEITASYLLIGFMLRLAIARIQSAVNQLQISNRELQQLSSSLEQRVSDRTKALTTVSEIGTAASTVLDTDKLLQQVVDLAKERFNFYHAHIYLLNETGDTLSLSSGAGEIGRQMVAEGRSIPLDREQSLVARAAREKKGVTVNDVTQTADFLPNPLLPDTHSEMAVPMMVGDKVIGVFDVQSELVGRFTEADISVQITLASQVASAIQNARLFDQTQAALASVQESESALNEAMAIAGMANWKLDLETLRFTFNDRLYQMLGTTAEEEGGYELSAEEYIKEFIHPEDAELIAGAIQTSLQSPDPQNYKASVEFRLIRKDGQIRYMLSDYRLRANKQGRAVSGIGSFLDITERKLLEELNRQRASQQEAINLITQKIQSAITVEEALQVAAREVGHVLGGRETIVSLEPPVLVGDEDMKAVNEKSRNTL